MTEQKKLSLIAEIRFKEALPISIIQLKFFALSAKKTKVCLSGLEVKLENSLSKNKLSSSSQRCKQSAKVFDRILSANKLSDCSNKNFSYSQRRQRRCCCCTERFMGNFFPSKRKESLPFNGVRCSIQVAICISF